MIFGSSSGPSGEWVAVAKEIKDILEDEVTVVEDLALRSAQLARPPQSLRKAQRTCVWWWVLRRTRSGWPALALPNIIHVDPDLTQLSPSPPRISI